MRGVEEVEIDVERLVIHGVLGVDPGDPVSGGTPALRALISMGVPCVSSRR